MLAYYAAGSVVLRGLSALRARASSASPSAASRLRWPLFRDILRVGAVAALITLADQSHHRDRHRRSSARFGPAAIAGYGTGSRLEYLLVPLVFGLGGPLVAMVGTNIGAGQRERALRVAWIGAAIAAGMSEAIGLAAAVGPARLAVALRQRSGDARRRHALSAARSARSTGFFGLGMALYFASQGAGRLLWPLLAN